MADKQKIAADLARLDSFLREWTITELQRSIQTGDKEQIDYVLKWPQRVVASPIGFDLDGVNNSRNFGSLSAHPELYKEVYKYYNNLFDSLGNDPEAILIELGADVPNRGRNLYTPQNNFNHLRGCTEVEIGGVRGRFCNNSVDESESFTSPRTPSGALPPKVGTLNI